MMESISFRTQKSKGPQRTSTHVKLDAVHTALQKHRKLFHYIQVSGTRPHKLQDFQGAIPKHSVMGMNAAPREIAGYRKATDGQAADISMAKDMMMRKLVLQLPDCRPCVYVARDQSATPCCHWPYT